MRYLLYFKPYDVLSSFNDPDGAGRSTLAHDVPVPGVQPAGRLDRDSEGLMLLTDDGDLAHWLTHPRYHLPKTYFVQVEGIPAPAALETLRRGVMIKGEMTAPAQVELLTTEPDLPPRAVPVLHQTASPIAWLKLILREGKKRQIRHMTAAIGHPTLRLVRVAIGPLTLRGLKPGAWRDLTGAELAALQRMHTV
jgi:23S rRNA pseudouridine2457 synthase